MSEWLGDHEAIALIRDARKVSEAVAVKLLVKACAEGLVRTWQRACYEPKGFGLSIPAFIWQGALTACFLRPRPTCTPIQGRRAAMATGSMALSSLTPKIFIIG